MPKAEQRTAVKKVENAVLFSDGSIRIDNVRASYPHLVKPYDGKNDAGEAQSKYGIVGLLDKKTHKAAAQLCAEVINGMLKEHKVDRLAADRKFLRDGDLAEKDGYDGQWYVSARESNPPRLRGPNKERLTDSTAGMIYAGCYVNILIRPWWQDHAKYGKRVNAGLTAVQFAKDGEAFGEGRVNDEDVDESFDDLGDGDGFDEKGDDALDL